MDRRCDGTAFPGNDDIMLRAVMRGERRAECLFTLGFETSASPVRAADLAEGILNLKSDPAALSDWASFVVATQDLFTIDGCTAEYRNRLVALVWDLAFGAPLRLAGIGFAQTVRHRFCEN